MRRVEIETMKYFKITGMTVLATALVAGTDTLHAQETNEVEQLKRQLQQMQENFARQQAEQQKQIEELTKKLDGLSEPHGTNSVASKTDEQKKLEAQLATELGATNAPAAATTANLSKPWSPTDPITIARAGSVGAVAFSRSIAPLSLSSSCRCR